MIEEKIKKHPIEGFDYLQWVQDNIPVLSSWLNCVEIVEPGQYKMQCFREPIANRSNGVLTAIENLKDILLRCAVLGIEHTLAGVITVSEFNHHNEPKPEKSIDLYCFPGYIEQTDELPKVNSQVTFLAEHWFELDYFRGVPHVRCDCKLKVIL